MKLWRIICVATGAEISAGAALAAGLGLGGAFNPWLDVLNQFAPIWLFAGLVGLLLTLVFTPAASGRAFVLWAAGVGIAASLVLILPDMLGSIADAFRPRPGPPALRLLTFNVWIDNVDVPGTVKTILAADPDVVTFQEANGHMRAGDAALLNVLPYRIPCPGSDLAIYVRRPPLASGCELVRRFVGPRPAFVAALWARVTARDGLPATVVTVHLPWPIPPGPQALETRGTAEVLGRFDPHDLVLTGDFNSAPWSFAMRHRDQQFRPLTRRTHGIFTWPARLGWRPSWFAFLPIDQVYAGPGWRTAKVERLPLAGSDHFGLAVSLFRAPPGR
jgi:endonuclease/exonuclease/phosphatase (EEP) superfamily protein YafD